ncbi:MAG: ABC transporter substrate-binding protein, partial [Chloroflexi bacterium]|nr:ABC transporter substrate-binding protein [Chloroflexota bacterium]
RGMAGENDAISIIYVLNELPLYRTNEQKGDFRINFWPEAGGSDAPLFLNQTFSTDAELGMWLRTKDFRRAISFALDRLEINEGVFLGRGTPQNQVVDPASPFYPGIESAQFEVNHDMAMANQLLDSLGLTAKDSAGYRLRTDGKGRLSFVLNIREDESVDVSEYIQDQLKDVGIEIILDVDGKANSNFIQNNVPMTMNIDASAHQSNPWHVNWTRLVPLTAGSLLAPSIGNYFETQGASGMAPGGPDPAWTDAMGRMTGPGGFPADISGNLNELAELWNEGKLYGKFSPQRLEIAKSIFRINAEEKYKVDTIGLSATRRGVHISRNNVGNIPMTANREKFGYHHELYYFTDGTGNCACPGGQPTFVRPEK